MFDIVNASFRQKRQVHKSFITKFRYQNLTTSIAHTFKEGS